MTFYRKTELPNGLRVITEAIPHVRSASVGVWVGAGSIHESSARMGVSHFIEHMLFKGTEARSAKQIAQAIEGRGGSMNAFTAKEETCFYAKVLDDHLPIAIDVLADMLRNSLFDPADLEKERGVILEEIKMYQDVPDDLVHDLFASAVWSDHALGYPIVGTLESVQGLTRAEIRSYMDQRYQPGNIVLAAAGNLDHDRVVEMAQAAFGSMVSGPRASDSPAPGGVERPLAVIRSKKTEQTHLVLGSRALALEDEQTYALYLLNAILGGTTTSRLFQQIREERGLAYSVYSYHNSFRSTGSFAVYAGVSPTMVDPVLDLILSIAGEVGRNGVTAEELNEAKEQLKGQIMLGLESTSSRMTRLGRGELILGRVLDPDEIIRRIDAVTQDEVAALGERLLLKETRLLAAVGPIGPEMDLSTYGFGEVRHG